MPYVITSLCTNDGACVEVCPVDAIFKDVDLPSEHAASIEVNAAFFRRNKAAVEPIAVQAAWEMVGRAHAYAERVGLKVATAVVDEAGCPIAVARMDGADPNATELAFRKAYTAAAFHVATADLAPQARRPLLRSLAIAHRGRIMPVAGGLVVVEGIAILGAVGVAGAHHPDQDILCSQAALAVLA